MPYKEKMPQINLVVKRHEDEILKALARQYNLPKASIARGFMRMGMGLTNMNPKRVLGLAQVDGC